MRGKHFLSMLGATALLAAGQGAAAQATPPAAGTPRVVTHDRVMQGANRQFDRLDANKDGFIDQAEYEAFINAEIAKLRERLMKRFTDDDTDKDGRLSRAEMLAGREKWFQSIDANHDGVLDEPEFRAARQRGPAPR